MATLRKSNDIAWFKRQKSALLFREEAECEDCQEHQPCVLHQDRRKVIAFSQGSLYTMTHADGQKFPRPTQDGHEEDSLQDYEDDTCGAKSEHKMHCTLRLGHAGDHVAGGYNEIFDRWPSEKSKG